MVSQTPPLFPRVCVGGAVCAWQMEPLPKFSAGKLEDSKLLLLAVQQRWREREREREGAVWWRRTAGCVKSSPSARQPATLFELTIDNIDSMNSHTRHSHHTTQGDKDFVWMLWKDLQKQSPDLTSTVDMIITRQPYINSTATSTHCVVSMYIQGEVEE